MNRPDKGFSWPVRVYYEDTDAAGIVYHANYLRFMERARTEWLRALGFEQDVLRRDHDIVFVITQSDIRYRRAARFNESLTVVSGLTRLKRVSMIFSQRIEDRSKALVCDAQNTIACVSGSTLSPRRIPTELLEVFARAD